MPRLNFLYAATLFLSAFLMFSVQPMVAKSLLPLLGGSTSVWTLAMVFFQFLLLAGYLYAHLLARLSSIRLQGLVHAGVIAIAALISLPLALHPDTLSLDLDHPMSWQMKSMTVMIAAPFFVLSTTAPLLQHWYALSGASDAGNPYKLYVASNIGSLLALLAYPLVVEPMLYLDVQGLYWSVGYLLMIGGIAASFLCTRTNSSLQQETSNTATDKPTWRRRLMWIFLAFCPSSLMLGYTTFVTTDVASVPLFWVIPLAIYLLTFIIAFSSRPLIPLSGTRSLQAIFTLIFIWLLIVSPSTQAYVMIIHLGVFSFTALLCHQELAALKPRTSHLTEFYLCLSIGGALGGLVNSILAPVIFNWPHEYPIVIALAALGRYASDTQAFSAAYEKFRSKAHGKLPVSAVEIVLFPGLIVTGIVCHFFHGSHAAVFLAAMITLLGYVLHERRWAFGITVALIILSQPVISAKTEKGTLLTKRNFYGVHQVTKKDGVVVLSHGTTRHGVQAKDIPALETVPIGYYYKNSGASDAFTLLSQRKGAQKVAILGLGTGSLACYHRENRHFDFYEIDRDIAEVAENPAYFTFLNKCGNYQIIIGDARQKIASAENGSYDLVIADAFSSDNVPVHIMTVEAVSLYLSKVKPEGFLLFNVSNRFFLLEKELALIAKKLDLKLVMKLDPGQKISDKLSSFSTKYVILTRNQDQIEKLKKMGWKDLPTAAEKDPWSDSYANLMRALRPWQTTYYYRVERK